jgi:hypothetical protein
MITITQERSASFSSTVEAGVNIEVFSAGASFTYEESVSSSQAYAFQIPAGSVGKVGFTPTLKCTQGMLLQLTTRSPFANTTV